MRDSARLSVTSPPYGRAARSSEVRVYSLSHCSFMLPYLPDEAQIEVLLVAHSSRRPGYWQARLRDI